MGESTIHVFGALALERMPGSGAGRDALAQREAGALAALIARDLAGFEPQAAALDLSVVGALYDPVELLRPGWPLHRELARLGARAPHDRPAPSPASGGGLGWRPVGAGTHPHPNLPGPRAQPSGVPQRASQWLANAPPHPPQAGEGEISGRIIAFGTHDGRLPDTLAPSPDYAGGPLRLLPWSLAGDGAVMQCVGEAFERDLMEHGMAGAETALQAQALFGHDVEHARYLTLHDLCALMAMQYEHAGLAPLWPLLETALLSPRREAWLDAPPEPLLHYAGGEARIALLSPDAWRVRYRPDDAGDSGDDAHLRRAFAHFEARQRQFAALLMAHGVPVTFAHCSGDSRTDL